MSGRSTHGRHRAPGRAHTPLTDLAKQAELVSQQVSTSGRRTAVMVAASGLVVSMISVPAGATTGDGVSNDAAGASRASGSVAARAAAQAASVDVKTEVETSALTAAARSVLATSPQVISPAEAAWSFDTPAVTAVEPAPVVPARSAAKASRSAARAAVANTVASNPVPASVAGNSVLEVAARYVGTPYVSGGSSPNGFDCSGFVSYVFGQLGVSLPRSSSSYANLGTTISREDAQPGDLIWTPGHIAIYAGDGQEIDASRPGKTVQFRAIWQSNPRFIRLG